MNKHLEWQEVFPNLTPLSQGASLWSKMFYELGYVCYASKGRAGENIYEFVNFEKQKRLKAISVRSIKGRKDNFVYYPDFIGSGAMIGVEEHLALSELMKDIGWLND